MSKIAFLIIDLQTVHLEGVPQPKIDGACEYINHAADLLRTGGHLIVHVQDIEGMEEGSRESYQTIPAVTMNPTDVIVTKETSNAFWNTALEQILNEQGIELVILGGFAAEHCVLFTYNGAIERGFKPVILQKGIISRHDDVITATYRDRNLISYPVVEWLTKKPEA
ncbi:isochorismatase family cysteine hydrolase [Saccharibacillus sp. CPCC 101409]|uniref:cysteine hydrolase family protein n=1 Tax=Saccharibacillus sp. CPCC 101409 TaxID=3058041 RepID=UPI0026712443|nr:isochorismatase family cysteine hydrolase [Saccharibacillus sp. CPCC 101409]MDO3410525.1 isochorismatase family cysteine hydrolase [Saccharibacillus sp. CPCC 101409]